MKGDFAPDQWAVVLGGSSGFGLATAQVLAGHGMNLCLVHRDRRAGLAGIEAEFEKLRSAGVRVLAFNVDATSPERRDAVLDGLAEALGSAGRVRVLLHSIAFGHLRCLAPAPSEPRPEVEVIAARLSAEPERVQAVLDEVFLEGGDGALGLASPPSYPARRLREEDLARTIHTMGTSLYGWVQAIFERGLFAADARVFGLTSEGNATALRGYGAVAAAKAALEALSRQIAVEFGAHGIRCNVLQPGITETPALAAIPGSDRLAARARLRNPLGRLTTPQDVARVIYLLSRDEAAWVNGCVIRVDGGEGVSGVGA